MLQYRRYFADRRANDGDAVTKCFQNHQWQAFVVGRKYQKVCLRHQLCNFALPDPTGKTHLVFKAERVCLGLIARNVAVARKYKLKRQLFKSWTTERFQKIGDALSL